jgi:hypothetical protein
VAHDKATSVGLSSWERAWEFTTRVTSALADSAGAWQLPTTHLLADLCGTLLQVHPQVAQVHPQQVGRAARLLLASLLHGLPPLPLLLLCANRPLLLP